MVEAAAAAAPTEAAGFTAGTRVGGECWVIPVGLVAAERIVPVGLVGVVTVRLPVGAVGTSALTAAAAVLTAAAAVLTAAAAVQDRRRRCVDRRRRCEDRRRRSADKLFYS
jgi:hypothetical protein